MSRAEPTRSASRENWARAPCTASEWTRQKRKVSERSRWTSPSSCSTDRSPRPSWRSRSASAATRSETRFQRENRPSRSRARRLARAPSTSTSPAMAAISSSRSMSTRIEAWALSPRSSSRVGVRARSSARRPKMGRARRGRVPGLPEPPRPLPVPAPDGAGAGAGGGRGRRRCHRGGRRRGPDQGAEPRHQRLGGRADLGRLVEHGQHRVAGLEERLGLLPRGRGAAALQHVLGGVDHRRDGGEAHHPGLALQGVELPRQLLPLLAAGRAALQLEQDRRDLLDPVGGHLPEPREQLLADLLGGHGGLGGGGLPVSRA